MKNPDTEPTQSQKEELDALAALPDDEIDTSDIPEVLDGSNSVRGLFHKSASERSKAIDELRSGRPSVTDTSERGLEDRICEMLAGRADESSKGDVGERPAAYSCWLALWRSRGLRPRVLRGSGAVDGFSEGDAAEGC